MNWGSPSLERVRNAVLQYGKKADPIRGNSFRCQCPAHDGDGMNAVLKQQPSGKISYTCHSHGCDLKLLMDVLDLVSSDFYPYELNPLRHKRVQTVSDDEAYCVVAESDMKTRRLTDKEQQKYRDCLRRLYAVKGAA